MIWWGYFFFALELKNVFFSVAFCASVLLPFPVLAIYLPDFRFIDLACRDATLTRSKLFVRVRVSNGPGPFLYEIGCQKVLVHRDIQALARVRSSIFKLTSGILAFIVLRCLHEAIRLKSRQKYIRFDSGWMKKNLCLEISYLHINEILHLFFVWIIALVLLLDHLFHLYQILTHAALWRHLKFFRLDVF